MLWREAQDTKVQLPVVFSSAEAEMLLGVLDGIAVSAAWG